ncbi:class I SAM-dependent methyltransferase [Geodermatophilus sp. DSM 44513]|uniref:class I SAM-dependent DNA methyltransferase n=1 Tax=Geodermatophilus sp. DSM 44513 TaxID=1528104 RepID=UPI001283DD9C|nr:class I SAM-dependent methyltransferase [Geodermatophilus sp. DSM 44513]WNV74318.1 class I SAM-dependent methyltransferase [Geodermatophilus sp. DSM 44513]
MADSVVQPADLSTVRASYDRVADNYVATGVGDLAPAPWLRAALGAFAEGVRALGPVLDVGCGPGTVTAHLAGLGVDVSGVDLSPRMIAHARRLHPTLRFTVASATALDLAEESLGGVLGWWSLFNLPRDVLPDVLVSFARALVPGGQLLLGTHIGDGEIERSEVYGMPVTWTTHLWQPERLAALLSRAGLQLVAELRLPPTPVHPSAPAPPAQVVLAARRPS